MAHGSVTWLGGNRWEARVTIGRHPNTGRRTTRSRTITAPDRDAAERALHHFVIELGLDPDVPATLAAALLAWFEHTKGRRTDAANRAVQITLDRHLLPGIGHLPLATLGVADLERFYAAKAREYAPSTVRHMVYVVKPALRQAVRWGWLDRSPADLVDLDLPSDEGPADIPPEETILLLLEAADPELAFYCRLLAVSGGRPGEIAALRWGDVDPDLATITISGALAPYTAERKGPKTRRSRRTVSIDDITVAMLTERRGDAPAHHYVFADPRAEPVGSVPWRTAVWSSRWARLCRAQGVEATLYSLRHAHVSWLMDEGVPVNRISARVGHARNSTTADRYAHIMRAGDADLATSIRNRLHRP